MASVEEMKEEDEAKEDTGREESQERGREVWRRRRRRSVKGEGRRWKAGEKGGKDELVCFSYKISSLD